MHRARATRVLAWAAVAGLAACASASALRLGEIGATETGLATWYSPKLAGRKTASGERYDPRAMTAAHKQIPFGTWIRVTRVGGGGGEGRSVVVRVNDRGPYGGGRIVDLSGAAAERLGIIRAGVAEVKLEIVRGP